MRGDVGKGGGGVVWDAMGDVFCYMGAEGVYMGWCIVFVWILVMGMGKGKEQGGI